VTVGFIVGLGALLSKNGGPRGSEPKGKVERENEAVAFCEDRMRRALVAPGSATFPWATARAVGNRTYVVSSYVDATNGFGGEIRTYYTCRARYTGDEWTMVAFDVH
jgi:hypothetical protein